MHNPFDQLQRRALRAARIPGLQASIDAWRAGENVRALLPRSRFWRFSTYALKLGVDLTSTPHPSSVGPHQCYGLPPRYRVAFDAWRAGADLSQTLDFDTYRHCRAALLERGFDVTLSCPFPTERAVEPVSLAAALSLFHGVPPSRPTAS